MKTITTATAKDNRFNKAVVNLDINKQSAKLRVELSVKLIDHFNLTRGCKLYIYPELNNNYSLNVLEDSKLIHMYSNKDINILKVLKNHILFNLDNHII